MSDFIDQGVVKVIEVIGISEVSFEDAIQRGVAKASESINGITGVEVQNMTARVKDGRVTQFHANMKLAFAVK